MKKAIIIGATSGLGRDAAARLVADGWAVGIAGRRTEALESFRLEYPSATIYTATMDVTREDSIPTLDTLINQLGTPDLLFYVSGGFAKVLLGFAFVDDVFVIGIQWWFCI